MSLKEPSWWYAPEEQGGFVRRLLKPAAWLYARKAQARFAEQLSYKSRLPVICVGNFTAGGTGKTPLTHMICEHLVAHGETPVVLTRGYGGKLRGPVQVNGDRHTASDVGDEPLLLARTVPVVVSRDRRAGAEVIERDETASVIVMEDGLQNPALQKDLIIALVDGSRGVGNGLVIPAGPLRAPLQFQLSLADVIVVNGRGRKEGRETAVLNQLKRGFPGPVLEASVAVAGDAGWLEGTRVVAYSGIGQPERFFDTLRQLGAEVVSERSFADHHWFSPREAKSLLAASETENARLVTTEKDWVRLNGLTGDLARLQEASSLVPIRLGFNEQETARLGSLVDAAVATGGYRRTISQPGVPRPTTVK